MKNKKPKEQTMPILDLEIKPFVGFDPASESSPLREEYLELKEEGYSDENIAAELSIGNIKLAWKIYQTLEYDPVVFVMNQANNSSCRAIYYKTARGKYGKIDLHNFAEMSEEDIAYFSSIAEIPLERN